MAPRILVLNPPSPGRAYLNRDLMGGMGVHNPRGKSLRAKLLFKLKGTTIHMPVMQLVYGATLLKREGFDVRVIDAVNEGLHLTDVLKKADDFAPDVILMATSSAGFRFERDEVARGLKSLCPEVKIIVVGDMVTALPEQLLPWFDVAVMGEVEQAVVSLCHGDDYETIPSIIWREGDRVHQSSRGKSFLAVRTLETLPFPDWSLFPYTHYSYYPQLSQAPVALIQASRGCPYECGYCPYPSNQGRQWRARSAENVYAEIQWDLEFGFNAFFFRDPLFTADQERVEALCDLILGDGVKIEFVFETRPELLTRPGLIEKLARAGCQAINFGVEDVHPEILRSINRRPVPLDQIRATLRACETSGIKTTCFYILGLPGATKESMKETIQFSREVLSHFVEYKVATPFPGTSLYHLAKLNGWMKREGFDQLGGYSAAMRVSDEYDEGYLEGLAERSAIEYYFHPRYLYRFIRRGELFKLFKVYAKTHFQRPMQSLKLAHERSP